MFERRRDKETEKKRDRESFSVTLASSPQKVTLTSGQPGTLIPVYNQSYSFVFNSYGNVDINEFNLQRSFRSAYTLPITPKSQSST